MNDTPPHIQKKFIEMYLTKSPSERMRMGCSMFQMVKTLLIQRILASKPGISRADLRKEIFTQIYGEDFAPDQLAKILKHLEKY
jgi:hypothetical protein